MLKKFEDKFKFKLSMEEPVACACCMDDISDENRCLYSTDLNPDIWKTAKYCIECARFLRECRYKNYIKAIQESDCAKELGGLIKSGPPIWLTDGGFPVKENETVRWIRSTDGEMETAQYDGAPNGEERQLLWDMLIAVVQPCIDAQLLDQAIQIAEAEERLENLELDVHL